MNKQELYADITKHLLEDARPSDYLRGLEDEPIFRQPPFDGLYKLQATKQSPIHHPEGSAWNHVLLVVDEAAKVKDKSEDPTVFMWAALLHDIGKPDTTRLRKGKITSYDHDSVGEKLAAEFLAVFTEDQDFIQRVTKLVRYHMHVLYVNNNLPFGNVKNMKRETSVEDIALLGYCDRMGRTGSDEQEERESAARFLEKVGKT